MRAAWRLAISSLSQRPSRSVLLLLVVAMSATLVCAVATAMASVTQSLRTRMVSFVGSADLQVVVPGASRPIDETVRRAVAAWPEVSDVSGRVRAAAALRSVRPTWPVREGDTSADRVLRSFAVNVFFESFRPGFDDVHRPVTLEQGRMPTQAGEVAIDGTVLDRLRGIAPRTDRRSGTLSALIGGTVADVPPGSPLESQDLGPPVARSAEEAASLTERFRVGLGDTIEMVRPGGAGSVQLRIVGIAPYAILGGRPRAWMTPEALAQATGQEGQFAELEIVLREGHEPQKIAEQRQADLPEWTLLQSTAKVTSNLEQSLRGQQLGLIVASSLAFLAAAFIILTGMTTGVVERQRELAILRCIGASRSQIAWSQVIAGLIIGIAGSSMGVPLGIGLASLLIWWFQADLKVELAFPYFGLAVGVAGSVLAGLIGALVPAWNAARLEPLKALASRAETPRASSVRWALVAGVVLLSTHLVVVTFSTGADQIFWLYLLLGLPGLFFGYFLIGVPVTLGLLRVAGGAIAWTLRVPRTLLERSVRRTPYRHGFTAGALMAGLSMMVAIWTQGKSFSEDWISKIQFPDAFVTGLALSDAAVRKLESLPEVEHASPLSLVRVETEGLGVTSLRRLKTTFIGFDPDSFFRLMDVTWVQGDPETAKRRLSEGGAVIVAREFLTSKGLGVGKRIPVTYQNRTAEFEIVGVVTSPGLDIVSNFFDLGEVYVDQAVSAVFGSRRDLRERVLNGGEPPTQLISLSLAKDVDDQTAVAKVREAMMEFGVLDVGSGRFFKNLLEGAIGRSLYIVSAIAVMSMIVACLGVANLIVAAIEGRRFEFGVLRAVGASRGLVCRLVLAEAVLVALAAAVLGTLMGLQGSYGGNRLNAVIAGLELSLRPQATPILAGWAIVLVLTLMAAAPAVLALSRKQPRELLAAMKG